MRAGLRLRMQRHHVGVAVHRVQHSGAQAGRAFLRGGAGSARGALQAPGRKHAGHQQRQREHQRGGRYPVAQHRRHDGAGQQRRGQRRQHEQEHSIQRVHVAGHARHQIAAAIARQLARRQADQRAEHQRAQIGQQAQRGRVPRQAVGIARHDAQERQAAHQRRRREQVERGARAGQRGAGQEPARHAQQPHARGHGGQRAEQREQQSALAARVQRQQQQQVFHGWAAPDPADPPDAAMAMAMRIMLVPVCRPPAAACARNGRPPAASAWR